MKYILTLPLALFLNSLATAQSFYEIKWESYIDQMNYTALVYQEADDVSVRVNYIEDGYFCISKYQCKASYQQIKEHKTLVLNTEGIAELVYEEKEGESRSAGEILSYFAFTKVTSGVFEELLIYNLGFKTTDKGRIKKVNPKAKFTEEYLKGFYKKDEAIFKKLHSLYKEGSTPEYFEKMDVQDLAEKK